MEGSGVKQTPRARANATVDLEAVPDYLPEANAEGTAGHAPHSPHTAGRLRGTSWTGRT